QLPAQPGHAGAVDEPRLHDQALAQRERQRPGGGAAAEDRLALDVLHVQEERLGEAALVDEVHDVGLRHRAGQCAIDVAHLVLLEGDSLSVHPGYSSLDRGERPPLPPRTPQRGAARCAVRVLPPDRYVLLAILSVLPSPAEMPTVPRRDTERHSPRYRTSLAE